MGRIGRRIKKAWFKSKTIIVNALAALPAIIMAITPFIGMPEVAALVPPEVYPVYALVLAGANLYLRSITTEPLGAHDQVEPD